MTAIEILRRYMAELADLQAQLDAVKVTLNEAARNYEVKLTQTEQALGNG
jgi:hypothetical protein